MTERTAFFREFDFELRSTDGDGLTLSGYAAVFNSPTQIREYGGTFTEVIQRGAFKKTLSNGQKPVLMFNHGRHPAIGDIPIGVITKIREDDHGLYVEARLASNDLVAPVREAIELRAITGMSFRFEAIHEKWNQDRTHRTLTEVRCPELGPVVYAAYTKTSVDVRESIERLATVKTTSERQAEVRKLRAQLALSKSSVRTRAARIDQVRQLKGLPPKGRRMTHEERIALYERATGLKFDRELLELRQRNPYAADIEEARRAEQREADQRAARQARIAAVNRRAADQAFATAQAARKAEELRREGVRTGKVTPPSPAESWQARVERRKRNRYARAPYR